MVEVQEKKIKQAWMSHADELTKWSYQSLFARDDCYPVWSKSDWRCSHADLTGEVVKAHFYGEKTIGIYTLGRDSTCRYVAWDIDAHDGDDRDPVENRKYADELCQRLRNFGANPLLEDSNGKGGFHIWLRFKERIPGTLAHSVASWVVKDCPETIAAEAFPKQPCLNKGRRFGNQIRLFGSHHKGGHWSKFYDGEKWLEGDEAVRYLLSWEATDPEKFPKEATEYVPPKTPKTPRPTTPGDTTGKEHWLTQFDGDITTLDILGLVGDRLSGDDITKPGSEKSGWIAITCPWSDAHTTGDEAFVREATDGGIPGFKCFHAHCAGRGIRELLEYYGKEKVDPCCAKIYDLAKAVEAICTGGIGEALGVASEATPNSTAGPSDATAAEPQGPTDATPNAPVGQQDATQGPSDATTTPALSEAEAQALSKAADAAKANKPQPSFTRLMSSAELMDLE